MRNFTISFIDPIDGLGKVHNVSLSKSDISDYKKGYNADRFARRNMSIWEYVAHSVMLLDGISFEDACELIGEHAYAVYFNGQLITA